MDIQLLSKKSWWLDITGILILAALFYNFSLGAYPLFTPDEGRYAEIAREMMVTGDYVTPRLNGVTFFDKPILYFWLQAAAMQIMGVHEWVVRFFPMLFGLFGILTTYICGRHIYNRNTGLIAAAILATSPLYFGAAHYANLDLAVGVLISAALLCFITAAQKINNPERRPYDYHYFLFASYIFTALAFLAKGLIGLAFPAMIIGAWVMLCGQWALLKKLHIVSGAALFLAIALPWLVLVQLANPEFFNYFFIEQHFGRYLSVMKFNNQAVFWFYVPVILLGFFPWILFLVPALTTGLRKKELTTLFLVLWVVIIFVFFSIPHSKLVGYMLPIFPALSLLVANYFSKLWQQKIIYGWMMWGFALAAFLLCSVLWVNVYYTFIGFAPAFLLYQKAIISTLMMGGVLALLLWAAYYFSQWQKTKIGILLFLTAVVTNVFFLVILTLGAAHLNQTSTKQLVQQLQPLLQPQDEVVNYFVFYQDVPVYLGRHITLVANWDAPELLTHDNWARELWHGKQSQNAEIDKELIDEATFWRRWHSNQRVFVFVGADRLAQFNAKAQRAYLLGRENKISLFSNQNS